MSNRIRLFITMAIIGLTVGFIIVNSQNARIEAQTEPLIQAEAETDPAVYVICDVVNIDLENGTFDAEMQNGEIHTYSADDMPYEFSLVCFETKNLDDFTVYRVVALR